MKFAARNLAVVSIASWLLMGGQAKAFCFDEAGSFYQINPAILRAISKHESNNDPAIIHWNKNGSYDVGLMGINSIHARDFGAQRWSQMREPCTNVMTGAYLLRQCLNKYGYTWQGIGCFNSQTPKFRDKYAQNIYRLLSKEKPQLVSRAPVVEVASGFEGFGNAGTSEFGGGDQ